MTQRLQQIVASVDILVPEHTLREDFERDLTALLITTFGQQSLPGVRATKTAFTVDALPFKEASTAPWWRVVFGDGDGRYGGYLDLQAESIYAARMQWTSAYPEDADEHGNNVRIEGPFVRQPPPRSEE